MANIQGTDAGEIIPGTVDDDVTDAKGGDDTVYGAEGNDDLSGGTGKDTVFGGSGNDIVSGGDGNDTLYGEADDDRLYGGAGEDVLLPGPGSDFIDGGDGIEFIAYGFGFSPTPLNLDLTGFNPLAGGTFTDPSGGIDTLTNVDQIVVFGTGFNDHIVGSPFTVTNGGYGAANNLYGGGGNDWLVGAPGGDLLFGDVGNDTLQGLGGDDALWGLQGDDLLEGGAGYDRAAFHLATLGSGLTLDLATLDARVEAIVADGLGGTDTLRSIESIQILGTAYNDTLTGSAFAVSDPANLFRTLGGGTLAPVGFANILYGGDANDTLTGAEDMDWLQGDAGNNSLIGLGGDDRMFGGAGFDTLRGDSGSDLLDGGDGTDYAIFAFYALASGLTLDISNLNAQVETSFVDASGGTDTLKSIEQIAVGGTAFDDTLTGSAFTTAAGGTGFANLLYGAEGNDTLIGAADADALNGAIGNDTLWGRGGADSLTGGEGNDTLNGEDGADSLFGGAGFDTLTGGAGSDLIEGGDGIDSLILGYGALGSALTLDLSALDARVETTFADLLGGTDTLRTIEQISVVGTAFDDHIVGSPFTATSGGISFANILYGNGGNDLLVGATGGDFLHGGIANDTLRGMGGDDLLWGHYGDDLLEGGDGHDKAMFYLAPLTGAVTLDLTSLNPLVQATVADGLGGTDTLKSIESIDIIGTAFNDTLTGSAFTVSDPANLYRLNAGGFGAPVGFANNLYGGDGNDTLTGAGDMDWLQGDAGNDILHGGAGVDTMLGGTGDDWYYVDNAGDQVNEGAGEGVDQVLAAISHELATNVENLTLTGSGNLNGGGNALGNVLTGNAGNNWLVGLAGNDTLDGGLGGDRMEGGADNDTYNVDNAGDRANENANGGVDLVQASISFELGANVENLTLTGSGNTAGGGNALANVLTGNAGNNWLVGLAGNDTLDGGLGGDRMEGGTGNDTYTADNAGDRTIEKAGEGTDTVFSSISFELAAEVENLTLTGSGNTAGGGNALANVLTGNAGNNWLVGLAGNDTLNGGLGADRMQGGDGNDTYYVDNAGDRTIETATGGADHLVASISFELAVNLENLTLTGSGNLNGGGNALNNVLTGNSGANWLVGLAGNDTLDGGIGADRMEGGIGNDTYRVDNAGDRATEKAGEGADLVQASISFELGANVENLTLTGSGNTNGGGNALANMLTGNTGENWLVGLAGNDVLDGGLGSDRLDGGADQDVFAFTTALGGGNVDRISGFVAADDTIRLENAVFTGLAAGALAAGAFNTGAAATQADDRIIYDANTGALVFDADGLGGVAAVQFATLSAGLSLTSADFLVI